MSSKSEIHVLFCANPEYFQHLAVAVVSLAHSNPAQPFRIHVLSCDRDPGNEERLNRTIRDIPNVSFRLYFVEPELVRKLFVDGFLTKECYLRLIASEILPQDVDRVIYLDCDLVVVDDILPLWKSDLGSNMLAAAPDYPRLHRFMAPAHRKLVGIPVDAVYVNSGVLLMDLGRWRSEGLAQKFLDYIREKDTRLAFHDQDAINAVLQGRILLLDPRWNIQARMFHVGRRSMPEDFAATRDARRNPAIIHFTGSEKPWLFRSRITRKGIYFRALEKTAWRGAAPPGLSNAARREFAIGAAISRHLDLDYLEVAYKFRRARELVGRTVYQWSGLAKLKPGMKRN